MVQEYYATRDDRTAEEIIVDQFFVALGDTIDAHVGDVPRSLLTSEKFSGSRKDAANHEWTQYLLEMTHETQEAMVAFSRKNRWKSFLTYVRSVDAFPLTFSELCTGYLAQKSRTG